MEFDQSLLACLVDELEGVHPKAVHVAVVLGDADVVEQKGELQGPAAGTRSAGAAQNGETQCGALNMRTFS